MNGPVLTKRTATGIFIMACMILCGMLIRELFAPPVTVVFCDVGQGNGAFIRVRHIADIVIDTGPDNKRIFSCLGKYMPFFDRTIDMVIISHPQKDHNGSLPELMNRYKVRYVVYSDAFRNDPQTKLYYGGYKDALVYYAENGKVVMFSDNVALYFLTPEDFHIQKATNEKSLLLFFTTASRRFLFTGDISASVLSHISLPEAHSDLVFEVPHHGSETGLSDAVLKRLNPHIAIISVGKKNIYGHPAKRTIELLKKNNIQIRRTDVEGDIVFTQR